MKVTIEVLTAEGAVMAAKVAHAIAGAMSGVETAITTRTRRTAAQIAADKVAETAATPTAETQINTTVDAKVDPVAAYLALSGDKNSSAAPDTAKPSNPSPDTAAGAPAVDPMEAMLAAATESAAPATVAPTKTRDEMIAAIVKLMGEKGVPWAREHIIAKYEATKFADMADDKVTKIYVENCV